MDAPTARQSALVARLAVPRWYHPASGVLLALVVASFATARGVFVGPALLLYLLGLYVLPRAYRRSAGAWYTGVVPPQPLRWARRLTLTNVLGVLLGAVLVSGGLALLALPLAVVAYVLVQVFGGRFDRDLRAELLQDPEIAFKIEEREG